MRRLLFWSSAATIGFTYLCFPLLLWLRSLFSKQSVDAADITPPVSLIIAAYNEADDIGAKLENMLALDYPKERLEILVASDGSDDGTNEIVESFSQRGPIQLLPLPRQGKATALNEAVARSKGDVLVFSDANSMFATDALRALTRPFADRQVGGVAGNQCYLADDENGSGEKSYWGFDRRLKQMQSSSGNTISATGAIYAIRRSLFLPVPDGVTDDFVTSTRVIAQGHRLVFAPDAKAYEPVAATDKREYGRKLRVMTRGLQAVWLMRQLLNPMQHGFYAFQLFMHKLLRRLMVFPLLTLFIVSPTLWRFGTMYRLATAVQTTFYSLALIGWLTKSGHKLFTLPYYFCMVNAAALNAVWNLGRGRRIDRWEPQR